MDGHSNTTLVLGVAFAEMSKPPMSDGDFYERLDPEGVWIEKVVIRLLGARRSWRGKREQPQPGQSGSISTRTHSKLNLAKEQQ